MGKHRICVIKKLDGPKADLTVRRRKRERQYDQHADCRIHERVCDPGQESVVLIRKLHRRHCLYAYDG